MHDKERLEEMATRETRGPQGANYGGSELRGADKARAARANDLLQTRGPQGADYGGGDISNRGSTRGPQGADYGGGDISNR